MGANVEELEDGMVIHQSHLTGCEVHGYDDHRMVMALSIAGLAAEGETTVDTAESARGYLSLLSWKTCKDWEAI